MSNNATKIPAFDKNTIFCQKDEFVFVMCILQIFARLVKFVLWVATETFVLPSVIIYIVFTLI